MIENKENNEEVETNTSSDKSNVKWEGFAEEMLLDNGLEGSSFFTNFSYDTAIVGYTDAGNVIYSYDKMIEWLIVTQEFSYEDAVEWIDYNTVRAIPYMPEPRPIIMYTILDDWSEEV